MEFSANTQLWEAFSTLGSKEWREMERFVASPFFNRKPQLIGLFSYLKTCWTKGVEPQRAAGFSAAYPKLKPYSDQKMRLANSDLLKLLERFWVVQAIQGEKLTLAAEYRKRNLKKQSGIRLREARTTLEASKHRNAHYYDQLVDLEFEVFHQASALKRFERFNLQDIADMQDISFLAKKLRHISLSLSHQSVFNTAYSFGLLKPLMDYVAASDQLLNTPAVALYYHSCRFLADPAAEPSFFKFRDILSHSAALFPDEELRALYLLAINFGVKKCNEQGEKAWYASTFELYKAALEQGLLFENGLLSRFAFNNIIGFAMRLGEINWAAAFIESHKKFLEKKHQEAAYSMNMARIAYTQKQYGSALLHLQKADYTDFINSMSAKILLMKIYYETDETDLLESHLESMQQYIRRQEAAGYHKKNYLNILRYTNAVLRCRHNDTTELERLRSAIRTEAILTERDWLLEQLYAE